MNFQKAFVVAAVFAVLSNAKPRTKAYPANCERVWSAVKRAAVPPSYDFSMMDDAKMKGILITGTSLTGRRTLDITLSGSGDSCTVAIGGQFSGLVHNDKGDLFKRIEKELVGGK